MFQFFIERSKSSTNYTMNWLVNLVLSATLLCFVAHYVISAPGSLDTALDQFARDYQDIALQNKPMVSPADDYNSFVDSRAASKRRAGRRRKSRCLFRNSRGKCTRFELVGFWGGR